MNRLIDAQASAVMPLDAAGFAASRPVSLETTGPLDGELTGPLFDTPGVRPPAAAHMALSRAHEHTQRLDGAPDESRRLRTAAGVMPQVDQVGRYNLEQRLGQGGLGTVWSAYDTVLARQVAVKTLTLSAAPGQREVLAAQVLAEARAAARLSHPHVVTVHDAGVSPDGAYIAMELLRGKDLAELLRSGWRPSPEQAALIVRRVADALGYAHSKGVIHRDVKPANIFMVGRTRPVVLDFGIARLAHHDSDGPALGSPYYAAPEQYDGLECDPRSDVYSLGVVLYELLTGLRPYRGSTLDQIRNAVRQGHPPRPSLIIPAVPLALENLVMQAIDLDPAARPRSAGAMARELRTWLATLPNAPGGAQPQTPLMHGAEVYPRGAQRAPGALSARERPDNSVATLPPAANAAYAIEPTVPSALEPGAGRQSLLAAPIQTDRPGAAATSGVTHGGSGSTALLPVLMVAILLSLLVLIGWLLLGRG